ncbi:MAG: glycosyltransferase family 4 protein [Panacagrimonas sp.]
MDDALRILHQINLRNDGWGGVEKHFCGLIDATRSDGQFRNFLASSLRELADGVKAVLPALAEPACEVRRWGGIPLPARGGLRHLNAIGRARSWKINRVLSWNLFNDARPAGIARKVGARSIYWERGAAWFGKHQTLDPEFADGFDLYLTNSHASRRMLVDRWNIRGKIEVCSPCVFHAPGRARVLPSDRPLRIGFAARLRGYKGGVLAVHALAALLDRGIDAELWIAGNGVDRANIEAQVKRLGLEGQVRLMGRVTGMQAFYDQIDVMLHPALREPYGLSCAEALTSGIPVVATGVDGLPEVVRDGVTGFCVTPTLSLADFVRYGGDRADVFPLVYRPERDTIAEPGVPAPEALADALAKLLEPAGYARFSQAAVETSADHFSFSRHVEALRGLIRAA